MLPLAPTNLFFFLLMFSAVWRKSNIPSINVWILRRRVKQSFPESVDYRTTFRLNKLFQHSGVFGILVLLHDPISAKFKLKASLSFDSLVYRVYGRLNYCKVLRSCACRTSPDHHSSTTVLDCWCVFVLMCAEFYTVCCFSNHIKRVTS